MKDPKGSPDGAPAYRFYGRRQGRPLRKARAEALAQHLDAMALDLSAPLPGALGTLFPNRPDKVALEIGFGGGEHLLWQAHAHPDWGFFAAEPFINGVARVVQEARAQDLQNVRLHHGDVRDLLGLLPPASLAGVYILFADPWPKARHQDRRLIQPSLFARLAQVVAPGGFLRLASDDPGYQLWILRHMLAQQDFAWAPQNSGDWLQRPDDWPPTRYEIKAIAAGRVPIFLSLTKT